MVGREDGSRKQPYDVVTATGRYAHGEDEFGHHRSLSSTEARRPSCVSESNGATPFPREGKKPVVVKDRCLCGVLRNECNLMCFYRAYTTISACQYDPLVIRTTARVMLCEKMLRIFTQYQNCVSQFLRFGGIALIYAPYAHNI